MAPAFVCLAATLLLHGSAETCNGGTCSSPQESASLLQTVVKAEQFPGGTLTDNSKASQKTSTLKTHDLSASSGVTTLRDGGADPRPQAVGQCAGCISPLDMEDQLDCLMDSVASTSECPGEQSLRTDCNSFKTCVENLLDLNQVTMTISAAVPSYSSSRRRCDTTQYATQSRMGTATAIKTSPSGGKVDGKRLLEKDAEVAATTGDCVDPSTDSPLTTEWGCKECLAGAIEDCKVEHPTDVALQAECLQDKACESTKITCSWKQSSTRCSASQSNTGNCCHASTQGNNMGLMERSNQSSGRDELDKLDDSMQDKCGGTDTR